MQLILISGVPSAGKSSFADYYEENNPAYTHVPLDKYIKPIPTSLDFLTWVKTANCIDWDLLGTHLEVLIRGFPCRSPQRDWTNRGARLSEGGPHENTFGRLMGPPTRGFLIAGTHAFSYPDASHSIRVFIDTPPTTIAARLLGQTEPPSNPQKVIKSFLGDNPAFILAQKPSAQLVLSGIDSHAEQSSQLASFLRIVEQDRRKT